MNWVSILLVAVIGLFTWRAYINGFVRELVSLSALILAIPLAGLLYDDFARNLDPILDNPTLSLLVGFIGILAAVILAGQIGSYLLKRTVEILNLGWIDRWAGAGFGFLKAFLLCQVLLLALVAFPDPDFRNAIEGSFVAGWLLDATPATLALLPTAFDAGLDAFEQGLDILELRAGTQPEATPAE